MLTDPPKLPLPASRPVLTALLEVLDLEAVVSVSLSGHPAQVD